MDPSTHLFWITSRASGTAALILASVAVAVGLAIGAGWRTRGRGRGTDALAIHEALSLATLAAVAIHGLALLGDSYLSPGLADITVPFAISHRSAWVALGIIAGYGLAALGLSYYFRARIGRSRWTLLHRFTAAFWLLAVIHTLTAGTDAGQGWYVALIAIVTGPPLAMLATRLVQRSRPPATSGPSASRPTFQ